MHRPPVDAGQHDNGRQGLEIDGDREQYSDPGGPADPRDHTHEQAQDHAQNNEAEARRIGDLRETDSQKVEGFHLCPYMSGRTRVAGVGGGQNGNRPWRYQGLIGMAMLKP